MPVAPKTRIWLAYFKARYSNAFSTADEKSLCNDADHYAAEAMEYTAGLSASDVDLWAECYTVFAGERQDRAVRRAQELFEHLQAAAWLRGY